MASIKTIEYSIITNGSDYILTRTMCANIRFELCINNSSTQGFTLDSRYRLILKDIINFHFNTLLDIPTGLPFIE